MGSSGWAWVYGSGESGNGNRCAGVVCTVKRVWSGVNVYEKRVDGYVANSTFHLQQVHNFVTLVAAVEVSVQRSAAFGAEKEFENESLLSR